MRVGENPRGIKCRLPSSTSNNELAELFERVIQEMASQVLSFSWAMDIEEYDKAEIVRAYETLCDMSIPADTYDLTWSLSIESLEGIDALRSMIPRKGSVATRICSFELPDEHYGELHAVTDSYGEGHRIELTLSDPEQLALCEKTLGLQFVQQ